ncbi:MAG TPA: NTP transferase domain-containing protein [Solirubrobacterales bacterium]|nr:NTP transferase domain-containing protein [Solirubrobacterales bacterium]
MGEPAGAAVGAVLAGGRGRRLGGAKPTTELAGRPLVEYPLAAVEAAGLEPLVVAKAETDLPPLDCRIALEPDSPRHPLHGILTALREAGGRPVVAVGCDMPFLGPELLAWLAARPEPLVLLDPGDGPQPFPGRYDQALAPALTAELEAEAPLRRTLAALEPRTVAAAELSRFGPPERLCFNVNTPADLARARSLVADPPRQL